MDLDGGNKINVPVNSMIASPNIIDNYFYYIEQPSEGASKIYKMKNDGTDKVQISSEESYNLYDLKIYNDRLYFTSSNDGHVFHLENMKLDGTEKTSLVDINGGGSFDIYDDWIYYAGLYESNLYKIKIDGSSNTKLLDTPAAAVTSVSNGWIYYYYHTGDDELCFGYKKVRIDGTDNRDY